MLDLIGHYSPSQSLWNKQDTYILAVIPTLLALDLERRVVDRTNDRRQNRRDKHLVGWEDYNNACLYHTGEGTIKL